MNTYREDIDAIRKTRKAREEEDEELYKLKLRHYDLLQEKKKFAEKEIIVDSEQESELEILRNKQKRKQTELDELQRKLNKFFRLSEQLQQKEAQIVAIEEETEKITNRLSQIDAALSEPDLNRVERKKLEDEKKFLNLRVEQFPGRIDKLEQEINRLKEELSSFNENTIKEEINRAQRDLEEIRAKIRMIAGNPIIRENPDEEIDSIKDQIKEQKNILKRRIKETDILIATLFKRDPQQLIEEWNDDIPILLLPLRIETKFKEVAGKNELWIRVFPDEIAIHTHEEILTEREIEFGIAYWKVLWATEDEDERKEAWSMLVNAFGPNRSAWLALQTKPLNWGNEIVVVDDLQFPPQDFTKSSEWTKAPHSRVLPDRFVLMAYRDNKLIEKVSLISKPVDDIVILGPAPLGEDGETPSIKQNEENDNRIELGPEFEWVAKFELAVEKGLGFKLNLDELDPLGATLGYDQLLVVGLKNTADEDDGKNLVENLIQNHHYSRNGFSLLKQGTPTNNTEEQDSGFTKSDPLNEESYFVEAGEPLFDPDSADRNTLTDGQRFAELLGIDYEALQYIGNSDAKEHVEASAMNAALYAGTLGYFMDSMLNDVVSDDDLKKLRYHFKRYVSGRGPLASIRVGNQPYGILLTSDFQSWEYPKKQVDTVGVGISLPQLFQDPFLNKMYSVISYMEKQWSDLIPNLAQISKEGDAGKNLMEILGLHPTSVEFFQRVGYSFDYLKNLDEFAWGGQYGEDTLRMLFEQAFATAALRQLGYENNDANGDPKPPPLFLQLIFQHYHTALAKKNLIDGLPFSETNSIKYYNENLEKHFIHWLIENAGDEKKLENKDFGEAETPNSLLFMLLLNSLLLESSKSIFSLLKEQGIEAKELVRSRKFMNMSSIPSVSPWEIFQAPMDNIISSAPPNQSFYKHIHSQNVITPFNSHFATDLLDHKEGLDILKDMSTASLERAMVEHIDTLTYRLDAWQTSLFARRLEEQRNIVRDASERKKGIYMGSYGYLENVKPGNDRKKINESVLPEALREGEDNLYTAFNNGGYVHAPSLNHATAAAILRSGYLTHASPEEKEMLAVNLSSERVRRALYLIEGIRNGQTLEVLLGYQFERGLHDWSTKQIDPQFLNQFIPDFRSAYPIKKTKVPQAGNVTGPEETIDDFHVVNGLLLAETTEEAPFISVAMSDDEKEAIVKVRDNILNALDALRDVLTAESAYQLAMGNFDRAAAVVRALADGELLPDIEVINTARGTNLSITNRVVIHFDPTISTAPTDWTDIPMTLRARVEPGINHWLGSVLGDPTKIRCKVTAYDEKGEQVLKNGGVDIEAVLNLKELAIQPIDFMYLIRNKTEESGTSELETRIRYAFAQDKSLADDVVIKIEFINNGEDPAVINDIKSFAEILPFVDSMRNLVSGSRPVHARDYEPASKTIIKPVENPENINVSGLQSQVENIFSELNGLFVTLGEAMTDVESLPLETSVNHLRNVIKSIADSGFSLAFPYSAVGFLQAQIDSLLTQAKSLKARFDSTGVEYTAKLAKVNDVSTIPNQKITLLVELTKMLIGDDYVIIPRFNYNNIPDVEQAHSAAAQLLSYASTERNNPLVMDEWLHGVALVRPKMHTFGMMKLFHDGFNADFLECEAMQLPYKENDSWLAVEYPEGTTIDHDTLSYAHYSPQGFDASREQCGLIVDDWVEVVPQREEVTGLTFNFNQPNSVPPQAILLAVTPQEEGAWKWNHLINTVLDTFKRAKQRAIEPDQLDLNVTMLNKFLPAVISEFSTSKNNISLDMAFLAPLLTAQLVEFNETLDL